MTLTNLRPLDLRFVVSRLPNDVTALLKDHPLSLFLAGGFIRATLAGEKPSDLDLFGADKEKLDFYATKIGLERRGRVHRTPNALTVLAPPRFPVQFITRWLYSDPLTLVRQFDFTVAQAAIWYDGGLWHSVLNEHFYPDLAARRLVYTFPQRAEDVGGSILRARKFLAKGYTIQADSLAGVVARLCRGVDQVRGAVDEATLARMLTGLLREVDPLTVVDGIDLVDEHEVLEQEGDSHAERDNHAD